MRVLALHNKPRQFHDFIQGPTASFASDSAETKVLLCRRRAPSTQYSTQSTPLRIPIKQSLHYVNRKPQIEYHIFISVNVVLFC